MDSEEPLNDLAMKTRTRRKLLFDRYSRSLAACRPEHAGLYACPICLATFTPEGLVGNDPALTEEHCPQRGLGKSHYVLTCKDCNSQAGSQIDQHVHKHVQFRGFWDGIERSNVQFEFDDRSVRAAIERGSATLSLWPDRRRCDPKAFDALFNSLRDQTFKEFTLSFGRDVIPSKRLFHIALLKNAYLLMFRHFGYAYILTSLLESVRKQIREPNGRHVEPKRMVIRTTARRPDGILRVTEPEFLDCYLVSINLAKTDENFCIVMPTSGRTYPSWHQWMETRHETGKLSYLQEPFDENNLISCDYSWK
jgi:hypothetical protein